MRWWERLILKIRGVQVHELEDNTYEELNEQLVQLFIVTTQGQELLACPEGIGAVDAIDWVNACYHNGHFYGFTDTGTLKSVGAEFVEEIAYVPKKDKRDFDPDRPVVIEFKPKPL